MELRPRSSPASARRELPSDVSGGLHAEAGLDVAALHAYVLDHGSLEGCDAGEQITNDELLELDCDILVLAAREDQVTESTRHGCARG